MKKRLTAFLLFSTMMITSVLAPVTALADRIDDKPYLALGADLTEDQRSAVLNLMGINASDLENYTVTQITNADEYEYLGSYLDASVIGSKALSSVKVVGKEDGYGIQVTTANISYCTEGMYQNALATAGVEDAEVTVVGPFSISGTAALVGAMKAYEAMTGKVIEPELADGATNELVVTSELAENIGDSQKAEELIAAIKEIVAANEFDSEEDIDKAINDVAAELNVSLSDEDRQMIRDLMNKLSKLDLDFDTIKQQAGELYDRISHMDLSKYGITEESVTGFFGQIGNFFSKLFDTIKSLFD